MPESTLVERLRTLTTPHLADACLRAGTSFREQSRFEEYLSRRAKNPGLGFREHLRAVGKAIEE